MTQKILFKEDNEQGEGKAKGVWMSEENEQDIPQIVGLSKLQFFGFLLAAILMGAGIFGIGYTVAYFKKEHVKKEEKKQILNHKAISESMDSAKENIPGKEYFNSSDSETAVAKKDANADINDNILEVYDNKEFFVILGFFKNESETKLLLSKLKDLGKNGKIKTHEGYLLVYMGPYKSESIAQSEVDSITLSTSLSASIMRSLP